MTTIGWMVRRSRCCCWSNPEFPSGHVSLLSPVVTAAWLTPCLPAYLDCCRCRGHAWQTRTQRHR